MTVHLYANGTGGTVGDELITETELYTTGFVYFVHHTGSDSNTGTSRQKPWASFSHAIATVTINDTVVLLDGHTETISSPKTLSQSGLKVVGEGTNSGVPTVTLTSSLTNQSMLTVSGINIALANIKFASGGSISSVGRVAVTGIRSMIRGCYFESGANDQYGVLSFSIAATGARVFDSTFICTSTTTQPVSGVIMGGTTDCEFEACVFDGGSVGFSVGGIYDTSFNFATPAPERLRCQQMQFLNGAGLVTGATTTGYVGISERTGSPLITGFSVRLPNGFRQVGDALLADGEIYLSTTPLYVHYGTGSDSNSGTDELNPKKTIVSAISALADDCTIIVLLPGHVEPLEAGIVQGFSGTTIIGCGTSGGKPSCRIYQNSEGPYVVLTINDKTYVRNIWIDSTLSGVTQVEMVTISQEYSEMRGCLVSAGYRDHIGVDINTNLVTLRETKIESTGTGVTTRASRGLLLDSEGNITDIDVRGCEFSNNTGGFTDVAFKSQDAVPRLYVISMTLSFGADVTINSSATGFVNPQTAAGSSSVTW